jgi:hypothetical protein
MKIYLLYKTDDMNKMTQADVHDIKNALEGFLKCKPVYDLAMIESVLWRVGVVETDETPAILTESCKRLEIVSNNQGFRGTALSMEGNTVSEKFAYTGQVAPGKAVKKRYNLS